MATTSIWSVKSTLGHVIEYAEDGTKTANPKWSKSEYQSMRDIMDYAMNDFKTEQQYYVTALNCDAGCAREQMQLTKRQFGKTDGISCLSWLPKLCRGRSGCRHGARDRHKACG